MQTFWEFYNKLLEIDSSPMGGMDGGAPPMAPGAGSPLPGGGPMDGGMGWAPGGPGAGALGGALGADPMGGMGTPVSAPAGGGTAQPVKQLKPSTVWDVLNDILNDKPIKLKKDKETAGQGDQNMLQGPSQSSTSSPLPAEPSPQHPASPMQSAPPIQ